MSIKSFISSIMVVLAAAISAQAGAPPTVMVIPDDTWAKSKGYGTLKDFKGKQKFVVDYGACFLDTDFTNVLASINAIMQDYGFPLKNYSAQSDEDDEDDAYDELDEVEVDPLDELANKAKPDMFVKIGWNKNPAGFNYSIDFRMDGVDSYSSKSVATVAPPTSKVVASSQPLGGLVKVTVSDNMSEFTRKLQNHFDNIQTHGREITLRCSVKKGSSVNFNTEFDGETLATHIFNWLEQNTQNHAFNERSASANRLNYNEVRIPLKSATGSTLNARIFTEGLKKYLQTTFGITVENKTASLGKGRIVISD